MNLSFKVLEDSCLPNVEVFGQNFVLSLKQEMEQEMDNNFFKKSTFSFSFVIWQKA